MLSVGNANILSASLRKRNNVNILSASQQAGKYQKVILYVDTEHNGILKTMMEVGAFKLNVKGDVELSLFGIFPIRKEFVFSKVFSKFVIRMPKFDKYKVTSVICTKANIEFFIPAIDIPFEVNVEVPEIIYRDDSGLIFAWDRYRGVQIAE